VLSPTSSSGSVSGHSSASQAWLAIARIKVSVPSLQECRVINVKYNEKLSQCGVDEVFETLLIGEKHEPK
jgi:hypothetical protein